MNSPASFYRKILVQEFEEKIHRVEFCLSHGSRLIQEIDTYNLSSGLKSRENKEMRVLLIKNIASKAYPHEKRYNRIVCVDR